MGNLSQSEIILLTGDLFVNPSGEYLVNRRFYVLEIILFTRLMNILSTEDFFVNWRIICQPTQIILCCLELFLPSGEYMPRAPGDDGDLPKPLNPKP
jgi:hypothetical protein